MKVDRAGSELMSEPIKVDFVDIKSYQIGSIFFGDLSHIREFLLVTLLPTPHITIEIQKTHVLHVSFSFACWSATILAQP